jgi:acetolactate synthase-1/3 small subunit
LKDITIATIVENKPGVLHRTSNVFRQRGYNISSISVGQLEDPQLSRMTFVVEADDNAIQQLTRQLSKQVDVIDVQILNSNSVRRELALIKINATNEKQKAEIQTLCNIYKGSVVDTSPNSVIVELTNSHDKIDEFIKVAGRIGIKEISRTGVAALVKG